MATKILIPEFFVDFAGRIHTGGIAINNEKIVGVGLAEDVACDERIVLKNHVVLPGFVNAHSHAFQRALRGLVERKPLGTLTNNFFSWRQTMYELAGSLSDDDLSFIAQLAYVEMLEAGFTHVGEFHYLHHPLAANAKRLAMSESLAQAADLAGINLVLLECAYQRNNFGEPLKPEQQRFAFSHVDDFLAFVTEAQQSLHKNNTKVGLAIHSVRAVDDLWFAAIGDFARQHEMPLHIHASEQRAEVIDCIEHHQVSPIALLHRHHLLTPTTTLVHATHLIDGDINLIAEHQPVVCVCPSTEKNLGDGIIPLADLFAKTPVCIGTDQHVRFDPFGEMRSLEELERLRLKKRLVLNPAGQFLYESLLPCSNLHGMQSLYPRFAGTDLVSADANLVAIELPPEYEWHGPKPALDALMVAGHPSKINAVFSKGGIVVQHGQSTRRNKNDLIKEIKKFFYRKVLA